MMHNRSISVAQRVAPALLRFTLGAAVPLLALSATQPAVAAPAKFDVEAVKKQLLSGNGEEIAKALETIKQAGAAAKPIVPTLNSVLKKGSTAPLLVALIETASKLEDPTSSAAIAPYVRHRDKSVRQAAAKALLHTKGPDAVKALRRGLRSRDPVVRGTAAGGLGTLGAKEALPDLFAAFDHRVGEAAVSIGQLCEADGCKDFLKRVGKVPFDIMTSGLDQMLFRPPASLNDDAKIGIIGKLRELGTPEAGKYLADVAERWPKDWSKRVKAALDAAVKAVGKGKTSDDDEDEDDDE
ncbi:MAG: HEAT repeat domain-containing protein [Polyangiaceae bacterium]